MLLSKVLLSKCRSKKSRDFKEQEERGLLTSLVIKTPLSKISSLDNILFYVF